MNKNILTTKDAQDLARNPRAETKSIVATKVSEYYQIGDISLKGKQLAEDIFRLMVKDVEIKVREVLAESLKNCRNLPQDVVASIITDSDSVAVPFLQSYADLNNDDMLRILNMPSIGKQKAIASRANLPAEISQYIVEKSPEEVVGVLISNDSANIQETTFSLVVKKYSQSDIIKEKMIYRTELPTSIIEKIANSLSENLKKHLILSHNLPTDMATDIINEVKEKTTLKISEDYSSDKQIEELVHQLYSSNRLTPSLVVRSICMGDLKFFEYAIVYLSNTPITEVRKTLFSPTADFIVRNLLRKAFIPKSMFPAVFSALKVIKEMRFDCCHTNRKNFAHKVIERILTYTPNNDELSEEDIRYLVSKIS